MGEVMSSNHDHNHHQSSVKILIIATIFIFAFAAVEMVGGLLANSLTLWSDAAHMAADGIALLFAAIAAWIAKRPPSANLSYGYGRAEVIGAVISSIMLLIIVIGIIIEAVSRLTHPEPVYGMTVMLVAAIGLTANIFVAWILNRGEKTLNIRAAILHVMSDILGSIAALIVGLVILFSHWYYIDPILSFFISLLILNSTIRLLREALSVLMESVPKHISLTEVDQYLSSMNGVHAIHDLHIWTLSSNHTMLSAHIVIDELSTWPELLAQLQQQLSQRYQIKHLTLQPEINEYPLQRIDKI